MANTQPWSLTQLRDELSKHPLLSNLFVSLILMGLEKLMELEFECPCNPLWNGVFSSAFFVIPAVLAFILMLVIQKARLDAWSKNTVFCLVPAFVWLILMFFDGQYLACAMTGWKGRFVIVDKDDQMKWCKPNITSGELVTTQKIYAFSQGTSVVLIICVGLIVCGIKGRMVIQARGNVALQRPEAEVV